MSEIPSFAFLPINHQCEHWPFLLSPSPSLSLSLVSSFPLSVYTLRLIILIDVRSFFFFCLFLFSSCRRVFLRSLCIIITTPHSTSFHCRHYQKENSTSIGAILNCFDWYSKSLSFFLFCCFRDEIEKKNPLGKEKKTKEKKKNQFELVPFLLRII